MLYEIRNVRQIKNEGKRRWFTDLNYDLIVWYDMEKQDEIVGFQLCYDKESVEKALTWRKGKGYSHNKIDSGEQRESVKRSPVLMPDGIFNKKDVLKKFEKAAQNIDPDTKDFIFHLIKEY